jgi:hypothetical protein
MAENDDDAIRRYLEWNAAGREPVRDDARIGELERQAEQTSDVLEKLKVLSELERVQSGDGTNEVLQGFVDHGKAWAERNDVSVEAFRRLGVPDSDLRDAGLLPRRGRRPGGRRGPSAERGARTRVSRDAIIAALPSGRFTKADLMGASGASPGGVSAALDELVESGRVRLIGPDPDHATRGRAPLVYERT